MTLKRFKTRLQNEVAYFKSSVLKTNLNGSVYNLITRNIESLNLRLS